MELAPLLKIGLVVEARPGHIAAVVECLGDLLRDRNIGDGSLQSTYS